MYKIIILLQLIQVGSYNCISKTKKDIKSLQDSFKWQDKCVRGSTADCPQPCKPYSLKLTDLTKETKLVSYKTKCENIIQKHKKIVGALPLGKCH